MSNPGDSLKPVGAAARDARPEGFPHAATAALANPRVRANIRHATSTIRAKRAAVVAEVPDWELLRAAGAAIKDEALSRLDAVLVDLESSVRRRAARCTGRATRRRRTSS